MPKGYNNKGLMKREEEPELTYGEMEEKQKTFKEFFSKEVLEAFAKKASLSNSFPDAGRGDGGATSYYELPYEATELKHLIKHKEMSHPIGEAFCALYRLNDNGEYVRNLKKALYYIETELEYYDE